MYEQIFERASQLWNTLPRNAPRTLDDVPKRFRLFDDSLISVVYAPIGYYINRQARIVIVGITPGWQQAQVAFQIRIAMRGSAKARVGQEIQRRAAFAGGMRRNLIAMLDELAVQNLLGLQSTSDLFGQRSDLLHSASALRYPVFKAGSNYSGYSPRVCDHPFLTAMLEHLLAPELAAIPDALIVPLGRAVEQALGHLATRGMLAPDRWLRGFPHPSGANVHMKGQFASERLTLAAKARRWLKAV